jgi:hypothetical protein
MEAVHDDDCCLILNNNMRMWNTVICHFLFYAMDAEFMLQFCTIMKCTTVKIHLYIQIMCRIRKSEIQINLSIYTTKKYKFNIANESFLI